MPSGYETRAPPEVTVRRRRSPEIDDADDVGVVEAARRARLGDEALRRALFAREVRVDDLDRDRAAERLLLRAVDAPHPADTDELEQHVAARQALADQRVIRTLRNLAYGKAARRAEPVRRFIGRLALRARGHEGAFVHYRPRPSFGNDGKLGPNGRGGENVTQRMSGTAARMGAPAAARRERPRSERLLRRGPGAGRP